MNKEKQTTYIAIAGVCIIAAAVLGTGYRCLSLILSKAALELSFSKAAFSLCFTVSGIVSLIISFFSFSIISSLGLKKMLYAGIILSACTFAVYSAGSSSIVFYAGAVFMGCGFTLCGYMSLQLIALYYAPVKSGLILGIMGASVCLATMLSSKALAVCLETFGWRQCALCIGAIILVLCMAAVLFCLKELPDSVGKTDYRSLFSEFRRNDLLHSRQFYFILLFCMLLSYINQGFISHCSLIITDKGFSLDFAATAVSVYAFSGIPGRLLAGALNDRYGFKPVCIILGAMMFTGLLCMLLAKTKIAIIIFASVAGLYTAPGIMGGILAIKKNFPASNYVILQSMSRAAAEAGKLLSSFLIGTTYLLWQSYDCFIISALIGVIIVFVLSLLIFPKEKTADTNSL